MSTQVVSGSYSGTVETPEGITVEPTGRYPLGLQIWFVRGVDKTLGRLTANIGYGKSWCASCVNPKATTYNDLPWHYDLGTYTSPQEAVNAILAATGVIEPPSAEGVRLTPQQVSELAYALEMSPEQVEQEWAIYAQGFKRHMEATHAPVDGADETDDGEPVCSCGVYQSEHLLCGCGEWEARR
jgi:hypothetical protein